MFKKKKKQKKLYQGTWQSNFLKTIKKTKVLNTNRGENRQITFKETKIRMSPEFFL